MTDPYRTLLPAPRRAARTGGEFTFDRVHGDPALVEVVHRLLGPMPVAAGPEDALLVRLGDGAPESYRLRVQEGGAEIVAADLAGAGHAVQILKQLIGPAAYRAGGRPGGVVPCGEVIDEPALAWRGGMLDVARHFMTKHTLLRYVDLLAQHRMNRLHLHLTDDQGWRVESRRHPEINELATHRRETMAGHRRSDFTFDGTPHGGYYTLDDLAEISAYAAGRGITVVPEIDLPGHASALLTAFPELGTGAGEVLRGWGISAGVLKPVPAAVKLVCELLDELLTAIDTPYVHLGGDECVTTGWTGDPEVAAHLAAIGARQPGDLHGWFLREIGTHLAGRGKRMVVWDEAFQTGGVLPDTIVMCWRGDAIARQAAAAGHDVVRAPEYPTYLNFDQSDRPEEPLSIGGPITLQDAASFAPLPATWTGPERARVLGGQFQAWTEYIPEERHLDYMVFPRACAIAETLWSGAPADYPSLVERLRDGHLARLDAAGCEYRPLEGPRPWQEGGAGRRAHSPVGRMTRQRWLEKGAQVPGSGVVDEATTHDG
ncbi:beta-N-acetylhexosaminidase [Nonomuraea sp. SBT364]|uniref:beta-N-acetylhexosaminidase n=1 Tax=Nonomuraea sp. SBT364 TaxID=1580530 RepID=UPI00069E671D|nr:beta-N-acetylhexosaminidase [Nonomuraea sp. SBT364]